MKKNNSEKVTYISKMDGYWYLNKTFQFLHYVKKHVIMAKTKFYRWDGKIFKKAEIK